MGRASRSSPGHLVPAGGPARASLTVRCVRAAAAAAGPEPSVLRVRLGVSLRRTQPQCARSLAGHSELEAARARFAHRRGGRCQCAPATEHDDENGAN